MQSRWRGGDPPRRYPASAGASGHRQPSWENVHAFLQVTEHGSFRAAALQLGLPINRLRQRVARLERQLGVTLLTHHVDGVRATAEGEQVLAAARNMETAYFGLIRAKEIAQPSSVGEVKLSVTEGLGTFWLAPRLAEFRRSHPSLLVDLRCAASPADMLRLEADAAVQLTRPAEPNLALLKLGRLHVMPYAAASYVEAYGAPRSVAELSGHRLVFHSSEETAARELYASVVGDRPPAAVVCVRSNSSSAHALAIGSGAGIGWLPTYASAITEGLVPIELDACYPRDIWLAHHPDVARIPRVRHVLDWIVDSFDSRRFPWFRDEFVHPGEFAEIYRGEPLFNLSGHFAEEEIPFLEFPGFMLVAGGLEEAG
jgi:DNA-binding transcriptional LysR family regulator